MKHHKTKHLRRKLLTVISIVSVAAIVLSPIFSMKNAYATQIGDRELVLSAGNADVGHVSGVADGGSRVGGNVRHTFNFTVPNTGGGNVGSIKFEYCTTASGTCTVPTGLHTDNNTGDLVSGMTNESGATGFTYVGTTNGAPYLTRTTEPLGQNADLSYTFNDITNPTSITNPPTVPNQTFFVRITTYTDANLGGTAVDTGTVAASTADTIDLTGVMPESLVFCTGSYIDVNGGGVPDCATAEDGAISFNQLFSPTDTATATSQMAASTNAGDGYAITVNGTTLMSGSNSITPMSARDVDKHGVSQFGMNLVLNTTDTSTVPVGANIAVPSNGTNYRGQAFGDYAVEDEFKYGSGDTVANSGQGGASPVGTDAQIYSVSYIVNVPGSQPAGTYTTTLTYICTASF